MQTVSVCCLSLAVGLLRLEELALRRSLGWGLAADKGFLQSFQAG